MRIFLSIIMVYCLNVALAQDDYFQQEVNYTISGVLDDSLHTFTGNIQMEYINNSPDTLDNIYLHFWANAFKNRNSAFNRQKNRQGGTGTYFAKPADLGNYKNLNFTVDGIESKVKFKKNNPDIANLTLPQPLPPGGSTIIKSDFLLKIPASFSRLGHVDQTYQMTQWYPKPAVYDREGWHPMPYLDMGEYYSEFGSFDVSITLPENYVVGATGTLQNDKEMAFLKQKVQETNQKLTKPFTGDLTIPASAKRMKTIQYKAENVHDFAWFADKRFMVQKDAVKLKNGKSVDTWVFFTEQEGDLWRKGIDYVNRSVIFYSEKVGDYPYPHATALQSALSAGGGMEYPMITVIGLSGDAKSLDAVITHEVGHNWFYGILGFNERDHAWLDEGINSYYDHRYLIKYYGDPQAGFLPDIIKKRTDYPENELGTLYTARLGMDQPSSTHSDEFIPINYWIGAYEKPAEAFRYLEKYLGDYRFDRAMKNFYREWEFRHPGPQDFIKSISDHTGEDLSWFFDGFIYSVDRMDYGIAAAKKMDNGFELTVKNTGDINGPFPVMAYKDSIIVATQWFQGFEGEKNLQFPQGDYDRFVIDALHWGIDWNRKNNEALLGKKGMPVHIRGIAGMEKDDKPSIYIAPVLGWNNYDKGMIGAVIYNKSVPAKKFEFAIAPVFSFTTKKLRGVGQFDYHLIPRTRKPFQKITFGLGLKSFALNYNWRDEYYLSYNRITPSIKLKLNQKKGGSSISQEVSYRTVILNEETDIRVSGDTINPMNNGMYLGNEYNTTLVHNLKYEIVNSRGINPWALGIDLRQSNYTAFTGEESYFRASLTWKGAYTYAKKRAVNARIFLGGFLSNTRKTSNNNYSNVSRAVRGTYNFSGQGYNDELYDETLFARSDNNGIFSQMIYEKEGGFKTAIGSAQPLGRTNSFLASLNLTGDLPQDLPLNLPLKPYIDLGFFKKAGLIGSEPTFEDQFLFAFGISLTWFNDRLGIYFPIAYSANINSLLPERGGYLSRVTWTMDLNRISPFNLLDKIKF